MIASNNTAPKISESELNSSEQKLLIIKPKGCQLLEKLAFKLQLNREKLYGLLLGGMITGKDEMWLQLPSPILEVFAISSLLHWLALPTMTSLQSILIV